METIEGNKLIAEFMGWEVVDDEYYAVTIKNDFDNKIRLGQLNCFHTSWDWLMPVVEKIANHRYEDYETVHDYAFPRTFGMRTDQGMWLVRINRHTLFEEETLIKATWLAVVDFIESYNSANEARELIATQS